MIVFANIYFVIYQCSSKLSATINVLDAEKLRIRSIQIQGSCSRMRVYHPSNLNISANGKLNKMFFFSHGIPDYCRVL